MPQPIRVLIADEQELFRHGLVTLFSKSRQIDVVAAVGQSSEAIERSRELEPDVILLDLQMATRSGLETVVELRKHCPRSAVVVLTICDAEADIIAALRAGASGYILKTVAAETLVGDIEVAASGQAVLSPEVATAVLNHLRENGSPIAGADSETELSSKLTPREREILSFLPSGASNRQIADKLVISEHTVRAHLRNILYKLGFENRIQAAAYTAHWARDGAITPSAQA